MEGGHQATMGMEVMNQLWVWSHEPTMAGVISQLWVGSSANYE